MIHKVKSLFHYFNNGNTKVFGIIIISSLFVTLARTLAPIEMNWDEAVQLEAAHRLIKGLGLTSTFFPPPYDPDQIPPNLNQTPIYQYLTWWPPTYSLIVAGFLLVKIPLALSLKFIYGITTIIGWFFWAILGSHCLDKPIKLGSKALSAQLFMASILPIFYTPGWKGTDLFLWASIPIFILLLFHSASKNNFKYLVAAGLLFGFLVTVRYATIFVAIAAFFILLQVHFPHFKKFIRSYVIFLVSSLPFILSLIIYNKFAGSNKPVVSLYNNPTSSSAIPGLPEFVNFQGGFSSFFEAIDSILKSSLTISELSGITTESSFLLTLKPMLESLNLHFKSNASVYGTFWLLLILLLPLLVFTGSNTELLPRERLQKNLSLSISLVPLSLLILLIFSNFAQDYDFIGTPRYYIPVFLPAIFSFYQLATLPRKNYYHSIEIAFTIFIAIFLSYNLLYKPVLLAKGKQVYFGQSILRSYLSYKKDYSYPSNKIITLYDETSAVLRTLQSNNPKALFFVQDYVYYVYDGHEGLRTIPVKDFWKKAYVEKAVKVFWVVSRSKCAGICPDHTSRPIAQLSSQPGIKLIYESPKEKSKILVSDLPNGYKF